MSHLELPPELPHNTQERSVENATPDAENSPERRRILRSGAQVLAVAGGLLLARPLLSTPALAKRSRRPKPSATNDSGTATSGTTATTDDAASSASSTASSTTAGASGGAMGGDAGAATGASGAAMAGDAASGNSMRPGEQSRMLAARTGTEKATGMQPLAPADLRMSRAPIGSLSGSQGVPATAIVQQVARPGKNEANDAAILNFALTLEFLEAEFYTRVVAADEAHAFLRGRPKELARALMRDEVSHVETVSDAITKLGGTPVAKPNFQFPAEAFISEISFLQLAAQLEETGVSAYSGQGPNVKRLDVLNFAASIYGIEARHTGLIRFYLGGNFAPRDMEIPLTMEQILERARPFIIA